jgi:hypothetical protein
MKGWIEKNVNPPGIHKKNRGSLYSAIGKIFERVKNDALKAFNAHFPYLADTEKLEEHGKALRVPRLPYDSEDEFRDRVAAAAFYHAGTGERSYIMEQLESHFGGRYILGEEFLRVFIKIMDLGEEDRLWVQSFFDEMLDPNVAFTVAEWFHIIENVVMQDSQELGVMRNDADIFGSGLCCDGRFYCDQGVEIVCDGTRFCNGSWNCDYFEPVRGTISDTILTPSCLDGSFFCDGSVKCSGFIEIYSPVYIPGIPLFDNEEEVFQARITLSPMEDRAMIDAACDGDLLCDGKNLDSMIDAPMADPAIWPGKPVLFRRPSPA